MEVKFKKLEREDIEVGDLYLVPRSKESMVRHLAELIPVKIASIQKDRFCYGYGCYKYAEDIDSPSGILVKRTDEGLEFCVRQAVLDAIEKI